MTLGEDRGRACGALAAWGSILQLRFLPPMALPPRVGLADRQWWANANRVLIAFSRGSSASVSSRLREFPFQSVLVSFP